MEKKYYPIFDQQIAGLLMLKRYRLVTARPDKDDKTKNIFFFEKTDDLIKNSNLLRKNKLIIEEFIKQLN